MKILLLGKNGQVGWELQRSLAPLGEVLAQEIPTWEGLLSHKYDLRVLPRLQNLRHHSLPQ